MTRTFHMGTNIAGLLRNMRGRKINFISDDNGRMMSDKEARANLALLQAKGHRLIGSGDCDGFDPFGGGCPGHDADYVPKPLTQEPQEQRPEPVNQQTELHF